MIGDGGNDSSARSETDVGIAVSNDALVPQGLCAMPLRCEGSRALIYVFSPGKRKEDLGNREAAALLEAAGYPSVHSGKRISRLIERLNEDAEFPHEIGLFLGYPPEDVRGFIENCAEHCKLCGYRKVYGDVDRAAELFVRCKQCTESFCEWIHAGLAIGQPVAAMKSS
ncbi:MAG: DUF3793 family protein [Clostridiales bacterium]|nr:DUF3793 family protein [Clostridiales bacterium]